MSTQTPVYEWLMANPGEHRVDEIANGTGLDKVQIGSACNNLKKKGAVANNGNNGFNTTWFALPGVDISTDNETRTSDVQGIVYNWLMENPGSYHVSEIATGTGLNTNQVSSAMYNLKRKGAATREGVSVNTRWIGVPGADLGARIEGASPGTRKGASPGAIAKLKFEKALEMFIDAAVEIKDFIVVEDQRQELEELRAFKAQVNEALRKNK